MSVNVNRIPALRALSMFLTGALVVNAVWLAASAVWKIPALPSPAEVYRAFPEIVSENMAGHIWASLRRIFMGVAAATVIGVAVGLWMGSSRRADRIWSAVVYFSYPVPKIALLPVVMLLAGLGDLTKVIMIVLIIVFQIIIATRDAVRKIPRECYDIMTSLGAGTLRKLRNVTIPAIFPDIFTALRVAAGSALSVLFVTETYGTDRGLGYYIVDSWMRISYVEMYAGILMMSIIGFLIFFIIDICTGLFAPGAEGR